MTNDPQLVQELIDSGLPPETHDDLATAASPLKRQSYLLDTKSRGGLFFIATLMASLISTKARTSIA